MLRRLALPSVSVASALRHHATAPPSIAQAAAVVGDASTAKAAAAAEAGIPEGISAAQAAARDEKLDEKQRDFIGSFRSKLDKATEEELMGVVSTETEIPARAAIPEVKLVKRGQERLPSWLKLQLPKGPRRRGKYNKIRASLRAKGLATVCEEANCPNIGECWGGAAEDGSGEGTATATIMMMGDTCTRACRFCAVKTAKCPAPLDPNEPENTGAAVAAMGVDYIVVTMVDRDDLADGGAAHVRKTMQAIKEKSDNKVLVECLAGDFHGKPELVELVATSGLDCYAHNIECVERITPRVRDRRASYRQSLRVLESARAAKADLLTKSSIMLGLGEEEAEIRQTLRDLRTAGVRALTLGQYLQPTSTRMKVSRYAHPDEFDMWKEEAEAMGFLYCASGPMVRSSYRAGEYYLSNLINKQRSDAEDAAKAAAQTSAAAVE